MQKENLPIDIDYGKKNYFRRYFHLGVSVTMFCFAIIFLIAALYS